MAWPTGCWPYSFYGALKRLRIGFNTLLTLQVSADILAITLLMYASGGEKSGLAVMLLVVLAGAGLVGQGRLTLSSPPWQQWPSSSSRACA
ncbi:MAG: hypothetical protein M5R42_06235 [Rhodocyclaceae bacterium]|nr:hypothetical protein [Rhodocyclaceae bacterium]